MKVQERIEAIRLRTELGLGYTEIAKRVGVSKSTLSRWLENLPLTPERIGELKHDSWLRGEVKRQQFQRTMREKRQKREDEIYLAQRKKFVNVSNQSLYIAGLMLYAAEGDKKTRAEIAFTNTDPQMIYFFIVWLERYLAIPHSRLRIQLHLYEDMDIATEELFWRQQLKMTQGQLCKSQIRPLRANSFTYKGSIRHGTCKLYVGGVEKKSELMLSIRAFFDTYSEHMQA